MNVNRTFKYLTEEKIINISKKTIRRLYHEIRKIISKFIKNAYQSELLDTLNENLYYSGDESLINHYNGKQMWLLGIKDYLNEDFRIEGVFMRDTKPMKIFITQNVEKGNHIVIYGWSAYDFLDAPNSGYIRHKHIHDQENFILGPESTSYVESLWGLLKSKIKKSYHAIPANKFMLFKRE